jgi:hypothetical protein
LFLAFLSVECIAPEVEGIYLKRRREKGSKIPGVVGKKVE